MKHTVDPEIVGWLEDEDGHPAWHVNKPDVTVYTGAGTTVEVCKLYGPLSASEVRVRIDFEPGEWVVEYLNPTTDEWEEKARWDCQENWNDIP